jgi:hypothetical protein
MRRVNLEVGGVRFWRYIKYMLTGYADFLRCDCVTYLLQVDVRVEVVQGEVEEGSRKCKLKSRNLYLRREVLAFGGAMQKKMSSGFASVFVCERKCRIQYLQEISDGHNH